jgi:hypothetical protein
MEVDEEIRDLLRPSSATIRTVRAESFLGLSIFKEWHAEAIKVVEFMQLFDFRLDHVVWKASPNYSVLLRLASPSRKHYFVTSAGATLRLYRDQVDHEHLLGECQRSTWPKLPEALLKREFA